MAEEKDSGEKKGKGGEEGKKDEKKSSSSRNPNAIVLKVIKWAKSFKEGVETARAERAASKLTVDPTKLRERLQQKTKKKVELLISRQQQQPKKDKENKDGNTACNGNGSRNNSSGGKGQGKKAADDKKPKELIVALPKKSRSLAMASLSVLGLLLLLAFSCGNGAQTEGRALPRLSKCRYEDITIDDGQQGLNGGIPVFSVIITNECPDDHCTISNVHFRCGWFSSTHVVNPKVFRRLGFDDCLVNDGQPLLPGKLLSFVYTAQFQSHLSVSSANITCS